MSSVKDILDKNWWRGAIIYQVYIRSFKDSNGDGVGDINGIIEKIDHIARLGADAVWITPFYKSPMDDFGYDVSDYEQVDALFGNLKDFDNLVEHAHRHGLKVIIDAVLNHTSDEHNWFKESRRSRSNSRADWYVWADPKNTNDLPNNWQSIFGGTAWKWEPNRQQFYFHNFLKSQPDLNFHNSEVQDALLDTIKFWLDRGVDGLRLDTVNFYFHDKQLRDNPPLTDGTVIHTGFAGSPYSSQSHLYDKSQRENLGFLMQLRKLLDEYNSTSVGEIGDDQRALELMSEYTADSNKLHMAYTFDLLSTEFSADYIAGVIETFEKNVSNGWPCWSIGNHDVPRVVTRWGQDKNSPAFAKVIAAMQLSLKGSYCIYQGEELGLADVEIPYEKIQDPFGKAFWPEFTGRDGCRTPIPWDNKLPVAGFTENHESWLPLAETHIEQAVNLQEQDTNSVLNYYRFFITWKNKHSVLISGQIETYRHLADGLIGFRRYNKKTSMMCLFNLTDQPITTEWSFGKIISMVDDYPQSGTFIANDLDLQAYSAFFAYTELQPNVA